MRQSNPTTRWGAGRMTVSVLGEASFVQLKVIVAPTAEQALAKARSQGMNAPVIAGPIEKVTK